MCYNIIDGRFHQSCRHFKAMSTRRQDCLLRICFFSCRHPADCTSKFCRCKRTMDVPILNPIRLSPTKCPECKQIERSVEEEEEEERSEAESELCHDDTHPS